MCCIKAFPGDHVAVVDEGSSPFAVSRWSGSVLDHELLWSIGIVYVVVLASLKALGIFFGNTVSRRFSSEWDADIIDV